MYNSDIFPIFETCCTWIFKSYKYRTVGNDNKAFFVSIYNELSIIHSGLQHG